MWRSFGALKVSTLSGDVIVGSSKVLRSQFCLLEESIHGKGVEEDQYELSLNDVYPIRCILLGSI